MAYKSEQLEVWTLALEYTDQIYGIAEALPDHERYGLASQMREAANSIALNIAEGSTGLSDTEQNRFLRMSTRSLIETVGTLHLVQRRGYIDDLDRLREAYRSSETLFAKLQAFRTALDDDSETVQEEDVLYDTDPPF
jgi:four helix bundle protein